ncbi:MAG: HTTM domain-containing protein [Bacteroidota bacterium]
MSSFDKIVDRFTGAFQHERAVQIFIKALIFYVLLKIIFLWPFTSKLVDYESVPVYANVIGKVVFAPMLIASYNVNLFYGIALAFVIALLFLPSGYAGSALLLWLVLNLYRLNHIVINGSDLVLLSLATWAVPMSARFRWQGEKMRVLQIFIFNMAVVFCQIHVAFIYFISGFDKLQSPAWTSGQAFQYIANLDTMFNPALADLMKNSSLNKILSWSTIIFELAFAALIWFKPTRLFMIILGVLFHLGISAMLYLPDFSPMMILSYLIFLKQQDYERLGLRLVKQETSWK